MTIVDLDARHTRRRRISELGDACKEGRAPGKAVERCAREIRLVLHPGDDLGILHVLEVAIGILDGNAEASVRYRPYRCRGRRFRSGGDRASGDDEQR